MNARRLAAALLLSGVAVVATATPAFAHAELTASDPAQGAALAAPPQQVQLTFSEAVTLGANPVTVTGPEDASWTVGQPSIAGAVVTVPVQPAGPAGAYTLTYRVVSDDGDEVTGTVAFTLTTAATTTTTTTPTTTTAPTTTAAAAAPTSDPDSGMPVWVWILGAAVVLVIGVLVSLRLTRRTRT
jgi:methionine-rich copper-binding protein CopC